MAQRIRVKIGDRWYEVEVGDISANPIQTRVDGEAVEVNVEGLTEAILPAHTPSQVPTGRTVQVRSPMPGVIVSVGVKPGQSVAEGDCSVRSGGHQAATGHTGALLPAPYRRCTSHRAKASPRAMRW